MFRIALIDSNAMVLISFCVCDVSFMCSDMNVLSDIYMFCYSCSRRLVFVFLIIVQLFLVELFNLISLNSIGSKIIKRRTGQGACILVSII